MLKDGGLEGEDKESKMGITLRRKEKEEGVKAEELLETHNRDGKISGDLGESGD